MAEHIAAPVLELARRRGDEAVIFCKGRSRSANELHWRVSSLAEALRRELRVGDGDRVAIAAGNTDACLEFLLAAAAAGAVAVPLNTRWSEGEAIRALQRVGASVLAFDSSCKAWWPSASKLGIRGIALSAAPGGEAPKPAPSASGALWSVDGLLRDAGAAGLPWAGGAHLRASPPPPLRSAPGGAALLIFTSGTTADPKACALSHAALSAASAAKLATVGYEASDTYLHAAPLFHVGGLSSAHAVLWAGGSHVFLPKFTAAAAAEAIRRHGATALIAVPAMLADLAAGGEACPTVLRLLLGGGATPPELLAAACALFPNAAVWSAYGMTEAASSITFQLLRRPGRAPEAAAAPGSVGRAAPGMEVRVAKAAAAPAQGACGAAGAGVEWAAPGEEGEVLVRGAQVCLGYWGDEQATAAALVPGGWLRTGDAGSLGPGGALVLRGRLKDMVKSGGENVHPSEVESALCSHPAVAAAAVVALPDARLGETVGAVVVLRAGVRWEGLTAAVAEPGGEAAAAAGPRPGSEAAVTLAALQVHCRARGLAGFKLPRVAAATAGGAPLPANAMGKVVKERVRRALLEAREAAGGAGVGGGGAGGARGEASSPKAATEPRPGQGGGAGFIMSRL